MDEIKNLKGIVNRLKEELENESSVFNREKGNIINEINSR